MFGRDPTDARELVSAIFQEAYRRSNCSQTEAYAKTRVAFDDHRIFDGYDKDKLIDRVKQCGNTGGKLDMLAPELFRRR